MRGGVDAAQQLFGFQVDRTWAVRMIFQASWPGGLLTEVDVIALGAAAERGQFDRSLPRSLTIPAPVH